MKERMTIAEWFLGIMLGAGCVCGEFYFLVNSSRLCAAVWLVAFIVVLLVAIVFRENVRAKVAQQEIEQSLRQRRCPKCGNQDVQNINLRMWSGVDSSGSRTSGVVEYGVCSKCNISLVSWDYNQWEVDS